MVGQLILDTKLFWTFLNNKKIVQLFNDSRSNFFLLDVDITFLLLVLVLVYSTVNYGKVYYSTV